MAVRGKSNYKSTKDLIITTNGVGDISGADVNITFEDSADSFAFNNGPSTIDSATWDGLYNSTSGLDKHLSLSPVVNQASGTGGSTALDINVTATALGSGVHNILQLRKDTVDRFVVNIAGFFTSIETTAPSTPSSGFGTWYMDSADSKPKVKNDAGTVFDLSASGGSSAGANNQIQIGDGGGGFKVDSALHFIASGTAGIGIGDANTDASGQQAIAIGQDANAESEQSIAIGFNCYASALNAMVIGNDTNNTTPKSFGVNFQAASSSGNGPEPHYKIVWDAGSTTNATPLNTLIFTLKDETVYFLKARVVARDTAGTSLERAVYSFEGLFYREGAGSATQQGSISVLTSIETTAGLDATFSLSGNDVRVQVTGLAATDINWITILEVGYSV